MNFRTLYLSPRGRIARGQWWMGAVLLGVAQLGAMALFLPMLGFDPGQVPPDLDPQAKAQLVLDAYQRVAWGSLAILAATAYPAYCLGVKRRHDRGRDGRDVYLFLALTALPLLMEALGLAYSISDINGMPWPVPGLTYLLASAILSGAALYMLVVLGVLAGRVGPNSYGPDPPADRRTLTKGTDQA